MANRRKLVGFDADAPDGNPRMFVRIHPGKGGLKSKRFPLGTHPDVIQQWADDLRKAAKKNAPAAATTTTDGEETFAAGVARFAPLNAAADKPLKPKTLKQYLAKLAFWLRELQPERSWTSITTGEVKDVLDALLKTLSPVTVYHYRTALMTFFETLIAADKLTLVNPVVKTPCPEHWEPKDQSLDPGLVHLVVDHMRAERYISKGIRKPSLARLRAEVVAATGIPPGEVLKLTQRSLRDLDANPPVVHLAGREKGKGTKARTAQLMANGVDALRAFAAAGGWGNPHWTTEQRDNQVSAMSHAFKRAARAVLAKPGQDTTFHLYALRHCVGAEVREVADHDTVGRVLGHAPGSRCTAQYTIGAHAKVGREALAEVAKRRAAAVKKVLAATRKPAQKLPAEVTGRRKSRVSNNLRKRA